MARRTARSVLDRGTSLWSLALVGLVWLSVQPAPVAGGEGFPGELTQVAVFEAATGSLPPLTTPNKIRLWAVPGQTVTGAVQLEVTRPEVDVRVTFGAAIGPRGHALPATLFDAWVLQVWRQAGRGVHVTKPVWTAELLLKDDVESVEDRFRADGTYVPPSVRLVGAPSVPVYPGHPTRFFVRVQIPPATAPGQYRGLVRVVSGRGGPALHADLRLDVLPITLVEPRQDRLIYYRGTLDPAMRSNFVGEPLMIAHFADIRAQGFTGVTLYDEEPALLHRAADLARAAGFRGPLVVMARTAAALAAAQALPGPILIYGIDEPNTPARLEQHRRRAAEVHAAGGSMMTAISRAAVLQLPLAPAPDSLKVANYNINEDFFRYVEDLRAGRRERDLRTQWYYWQSMMEKPNVARVLSGFYLWASGLDGICPYVYQHVPEAPQSPYDESDDWTGTLRMHFTTYPAQAGAIPTIQWEAIRAGIDDLRFVTTLEQALERSRSTRARARATAVLARVRQLIRPRLAETDPSTREPYSSLRAGDYDAVRRQIAEAILDLAREETRAR